METDLPTIAKQLRTLDRNDIRNWLQRGQLLTQARDLVGNDAGFGRFCKDEGIALRTAQKAMAAWRHFGDTPTSARFSKEAMAILAQSPEARTDAIELSKKEKITARIARALVSKYIVAFDDIETPTVPKNLTRTFSVEGAVVIIKAEGQPTPSDLLAIMMQVTRQLREPLAAEPPPFAAVVPRRSAG